MIKVNFGKENFSFEVFSEGTPANAITNLPTDTVSVSNDIPVSIMKKTTDAYCPKLTQIMNDCLKNIFFPDILVWNFYSMLSSMVLLQCSIVKQNQCPTEKGLHFLLNDYDSTPEDLLQKSGYPNMNLRRQRTPCIEIYETLNKLSPGYINDIFKLRNTEKNTN